MLIFPSVGCGQELTSEKVGEIMKMFEQERTGWPIRDEWRKEMRDRVKKREFGLYSLDAVDDVTAYREVAISWGSWKQLIKEDDRNRIQRSIEEELERIGLKKDPKAGIQININTQINHEKGWPMMIFVTVFSVREMVKVIRDGEEVFHRDAATYWSSHHGAVPLNSNISPTDLVSRTISGTLEKFKKDYKE